MKLISTARISKFNPLKNPKGFSLVEIMVALMLVALVFTIMPYDGENPQAKNLTDSTTIIKRAVRFSVNESILRNKIVRIKFKIETSPVEYSIESGNSANLVLLESVDLSRLSNREREEYAKKTEKFDGQFTPITEFMDGEKTLPEGVELFGIGTSYYPKLVLNGEPSLYFYPSGEKDNAIIFLNTQSELVSISIAPFEDLIEENKIAFTQQESENLNRTLEDKTKDQFEKWLKD